MVSQCRSAAFILVSLAFSVLAKVQVYQPASIYKLSNTFKLTVGGQKVPVVAHDDYDYAHLSTDSEADVQVNVIERVPIRKASIVSSRFDYNNPVTLNKNTLTWRLNDPKYYILKVEGLRELVVAVDSIETDVPSCNGPNIFNVASNKYKADKSGRTDATGAFEAAISDAQSYQGENPTVYVPAGVFVIGNLVLPSNTNLYLAPGAVLRSTGNPDDYIEDWSKDGEGRAGTNWISTEHGSTNIKIYGRGTIDGNAFALKEAMFAHSLVVPILTSQFTLDGVILREAGSTALNVVRSNGVRIHNVKVLNRIANMIDNGSIDVIESQNVTVDNAVAISLSDTFTTKASKPPSDTVPTWPGTLQPSSDILFSNCLAWTSNYGFKVGQGAMSDQSNIVFLNSTVYDAAVAMGVHKKWGNGGATNITFENMLVKSTSYTTSRLKGMVGSWLALFIEDGGFGAGPISDVHVNNVMVMGTSGSAPLISGVEGADVSNVELRNIRIPGMSQPGMFETASSPEDLGLDLESMPFASNITVVDGSSLGCGDDSDPEGLPKDPEGEEDEELPEEAEELPEEPEDEENEELPEDPQTTLELE